MHLSRGVGLLVVVGILSLSCMGVVCKPVAAETTITNWENLVLISKDYNVPNKIVIGINPGFDADLYLRFDNNGLRQFTVVFSESNPWEHGPSDKYSQVSIDFVSQGAYPTGSVQIGPEFFPAGVYHWFTFKNIVGDAGASAMSYDALEPVVAV